MSQQKEEPKSKHNEDVIYLEDILLVLEHSGLLEEVHNAVELGIPQEVVDRSFQYILTSVTKSLMEGELHLKEEEDGTLTLHGKKPLLIWSKMKNMILDTGEEL